MTNVGVKIPSSVIFQTQDLISCQPRLCSQTETSRDSSCWFSFTGREIKHSWISNATHTEVRDKGYYTGTFPGVGHTLSTSSTLKPSLNSVAQAPAACYMLCWISTLFSCVTIIAASD